MCCAVHPPQEPKYGQGGVVVLVSSICFVRDLYCSKRNSLAPFSFCHAPSIESDKALIPTTRIIQNPPFSLYINEKIMRDVRFNPFHRSPYFAVLIDIE